MKKLHVALIDANGDLLAALRDLASDPAYLAALLDWLGLDDAGE